MARRKVTTDLYLRLPPDVHTEIKILAEKENRSLNAQIVTLLQEALAQRANSPALTPPAAP